VLVPWAFLDTPGIDALDIAVYVALQRYTDFGATTGCSVSDATGARTAKVSPRTFSGRRKKLRDLGWITWKSGKAEGEVNQYVVRRSLVTGGRQQVPTSSATDADPGQHVVLTTESHDTKSDCTERESTTRAAPRVENLLDRDTRPTDFGTQQLLDLVRSRLYVPDGLPPRGWAIARDGHIIKRLRSEFGYTGLEIAGLIEGLALLRDYPGRYGDEVTWLPRGQKITLGVLFKRSGALSMIERARQAYWKHSNTRSGPDGAHGPQLVGAVLRRAMGAS